MAQKTNKNAMISCCPALFMSAGALVDTLVSAATPIGLQEARLRTSVRETHQDLRISWTLSAAKLPCEERASLIVEFLEVPDEPIDFGDLTAATI